MTLHVGIDGNEANVAKRVGSNQYAFGILWGLYRLRPANTHFTVYLKHMPLSDLPKATTWWQYRVIRPSFAWTQWRLPLDLFWPFHRLDVFYSPGHYAPRWAPMPTVVTIMDLAFLKLPKLFLRYKRGAKQLTEWTEYSVKQAKHIIAISENTKQDVVETYRIPADKITVAYPGVDLTKFNQAPQKLATIKQTYQLPDKYILHLGTLQPRKNIVRLINAFEALPPKYRQVHLVLAGQSGWLIDDIEAALNQSPKKDSIHRLGYVADADIPVLIAGASCVALAGLYEGFGMPPAEALACGTIPIVSNNSSLPEVVGEAGILVDPYSVASITHGIIAALEMTPEQKIRRLALGRKHIMKFNWDQSAQQILTVLQGIGRHDVTI